jgi:hypothetical protein
METELTFGGILSDAFKIGLKNFLSILVNYILWILTIWIPYLNVGTTIGLMTLPISLSKGEIISPVEIFKAKYRKYMGEFFLISGLTMMVIFTAMIFMVIPAIVIGISWSLGTYLMIDKGLNPIEALMTSNKITNGKKWTIFFSFLALIVPFIIIFLISLASHSAGMILGFIYFIILIPIILGAQAHIYGVLSQKV